MSFRTQLKRALGSERIIAFNTALGASMKESSPAPVGNFEVIVAFFVGLLPLIPSVVHFSNEIDYPTVLVGAATCLAIICRRRFGMRMLGTTDWKSALSLTHTGFALGCVPAVLLLIFDPASLTTITSHHSTQAVSQPGGYMLLKALFFIVSVALWAGITEEFIYRGLVISALRRWSAIKDPVGRSVFAVVVSSLLFGLSHFGTWGPGFSLALVGVGIGLGLGYLAIGERLLPVIAYHIAFDVLSLTCAIFLRR